MDAYTQKHLAKWTERQFSPLVDRAIRYAAMARVCEENPGIENGDRGWWRAYELALELGYLIDED